MLNFILGARFSYADILVYALTITIASSGYLWSAIGFGVTGLFLTTYIEMKLGFWKVR